MEGAAPVLQKPKGLSQLFLVAANAFSLVCAVEAGALAIILAITALVTGGLSGGVSAYYPLWFGISAAISGLVALWTAKKVTDVEMLKKAYGIATAFVLVELVLAATATISLVLFALFAIGADGVSQQSLWLNSFLPYLGATAVLAGLLVVVKKISDGVTKLLPIIIYIVFGMAGIALILAIIAVFVGLYGGSSSRYSPSYYDYDY
jgi:hypothetical protein